MYDLYSLASPTFRPTSSLPPSLCPSFSRPLTLSVPPAVPLSVPPPSLFRPSVPPFIHPTSRTHPSTSAHTHTHTLQASFCDFYHSFYTIFGVVAYSQPPVDFNVFDNEGRVSQREPML